MPEEANNSEEPTTVVVEPEEKPAETEDEQTDESESTEETSSESEEEESESDGSETSENNEEDNQLSALPESLRTQIKKERQMLEGVRNLVSDLGSGDPNLQANAIAYLNEEFKLNIPDPRVQQEAKSEVPEWEALGLTEEDYEYHKPAIDAAKKLLETQYRSKIDALEQRFAQIDNEAKTQKFIDDNFARVAAKVRAEAKDYNISKADLAEAVKAFPNLPPYEAVMAKHSAKILRFALSKAEKEKKGPAMIHSTGKGDASKIGEEPYTVPVK